MVFILCANIENSEKNDTEISHNLKDNASKHPSLDYAKSKNAGFSDTLDKLKELTEKFSVNHGIGIATSNKIFRNNLRNRTSRINYLIYT